MSKKNKKLIKYYICLFSLAIILGIFILNPVTSFGYVEQREHFITTPMIAAGSSHTVALRSDGTVWTWGSNYAGQLGDGSNNRTVRLTPVQVSDLSFIVAVAAGEGYTMALKRDGTVWLWGLRTAVKNDRFTDTHVPTQVKELDDVIAIAAGNRHFLAFKNDGTVWAWGNNFGTQLGFGEMWPSKNADVFPPVNVRLPNNIVAIASGTRHSLALESDGTVWIWGSDGDRMLGEYENSNYFPAKINDLGDIIALEGGSGYTIAIKRDQTVWAWGVNSNGQLGTGELPSRRSWDHMQLHDLIDIIKVDAEFRHTVALRNDGAVFTWGYNSDGQLGDGTREDKNSPVQVQGIDSVIDIAAGGYHTIALRDDDTLWAWGSNSAGQLGNNEGGSEYDHSTTPVQVLGPEGVGYFNMYGDLHIPDIPIPEPEGHIPILNVFLVIIGVVGCLIILLVVSLNNHKKRK